MGRWHAHELVRAEGVVAAVIDPDASAAGRLASRYGAVPVFADLAEALVRSDLDVVHVCTPTSSHVQLVRQALEGGADVLVEKPLAPDAGATEELIAAAQAAGRLLCPVHQYLFQPGFEMARRAAPDIAPWRHLETTTCSAGGAGRPQEELAAIVVDILPHALAALERLLPTGLAGANWSAVRLRDGELRAAGEAGDSTISLLVSMSGRPTRNELRLIGDGGTIELDFFHGYGFVEGGRPSRATKALRPFAISARRAGAAASNLTRRTVRWEPAYPGLRTLIERFYAASSSRGAPPIDVGETLAVASARDTLIALSEAAAGEDKRDGAQQHLGVEPQ